MSKGLNEFLNALFASEGGTDPGIENKYGYIGKYQFGEPALLDLGYYKGDPSDNKSASGRMKYDWSGDWTGKNGATSKAVFLASPSIQDAAARDWVALLCKRMKHFKLAQYIGDTIGGVEVTESGIIAAAHLKGFGSAKYPGVKEFLRSGGEINGADANGTTVGDYMARFAGYELGCCEHLTLNFRDRDKDPIPGLAYELRQGNRTVKRGKTDSLGMSREVAISDVPISYQVFVSRIEGGMKKVAEFASPLRSALVTLISPKVKVDATVEKHDGEAGSYRPGKPSASPAVFKERTRAESQRNAKGKPVAVARPRQRSGHKLSGADWEQYFPTSVSVSDLTPDFAEKVNAFIGALREAGIKVRIAATFRPRERAYLMHYCCKIGKGEISPDKVPPMKGVDIDWVHRDARGQMDLKASRAAAQAMMRAYVIRFPAALKSRHTERRAIDMTITGFKGKLVKDFNGNDVELSDSSDLHNLGRTYGVIKLKSDPPHWSDDGR